MAQRPNPIYAPQRMKAKRNNTSTFGDQVAAVLNIIRRQFRILIQEADNEDQPIITLVVEPASKGIQLTTLTVEELDALQEFYNFAFDMARPICEELDNETRAAYERGEDAKSRLYRQAPFITFRPRIITEHYKGLQGGPGSAAFVARGKRAFARWPSVGHLGRTGNSGSALADDPQDGLGTSDDAPEDGGD